MSALAEAADDGEPAKKRVVIIVGAGIIGASLAYYLTKEHNDITPVLLEKCDVACHSSGKAGGFLTRTWNNSSSVGELSRVSFALHAALADELGADEIGYRRMACIGVGFGAHPLGGAAAGAAGSAEGGADRAPRRAAWLDRGTSGRANDMGGEDECAQVTPARLTRALVRAARARGALLRRGATVLGIERGSADADGGDGAVAAVRVMLAPPPPSGEEDGSAAEGCAADDDDLGALLGGGGGGGTDETAAPQRLPCDAVALCMGAWSGAAAEWFPRARLPLSRASAASHKYTSVVWDAVLDNTAVFLESRHHVEIYPRADETYACGCPEDAPLPDDPRAIGAAPAAARAVASEAERVASSLAEQPPRAARACFLPGSDDGEPVVGAVGGEVNVFVACGHTCWGILNAPATGKALAELIARGAAAAVDLAPFDPQRG